MMSSAKWGALGGAAVGIGLLVLLAWFTKGTLKPVEVGGPAPQIATYDLDGNPRSLDDYRGSVVLLNIWATWCAPCKAEMPSMQRLYEEMAGEDFRVVAVSIDRVRPDHDPANPLGGRLQAFVDSLGLTFTILHDPEGSITTSYQTTGVPESFILDREGIIMEKISGPRSWDEPREVERIRAVLEEGDGPGS